MLLRHLLSLFALTLIAPFSLHAQRLYTLDAPQVPMTVTEGQIQLGGTSPQGGSISVNSYYMNIDGQPTIPVMGEFHYARYPREQWEEEIIKMKAGGITVLPTYIFWSLHEPQPGQFCWSGQLDLRHFIQLCARHQMSVIVRIGPFCHGEIRNGGLPDWLFAQPLDVRSNDPLYLQYVQRLYHQIGQQLQGLYYQEGGPIIGCQIENELQHSAAPWGLNYLGEPKDMTSANFDVEFAMIGVGVQDRKVSKAELGEEHMRNLKQMAQAEGIITPLYTATGWGNAAVIGYEALPVTAAYTYPFWAKPSMSKFCMFKDLHHEPDYSPVRFRPEDFPSFCAEMGVGIQMIYARRPIVTAQAAQALMIRTLGSGSNGIGYYMYHGGSTPLRSDGIGSFQDEPMGMPKISYDFQAPLGEFGLEHPSYRYLRTIHTFLADFGHLLAPMETVLPADWQQMTPDNRDDLRYAARMRDGHGFLFMVNFQDHDTARHDLTDLQIRLNLPGETLQIPAQGTFTLPRDASMILPFNLDLQGALLKYATAQPLMQLDDRGIPHYIFFAPEGMTPEYAFDPATVRGSTTLYRPRECGTGSTFTVTTRQGQRVRITTLTMQQALCSSKVHGQLLITSATVLPQADAIALQQLASPDFSYILYPSHGWQEQHVSVPAVTAPCQVQRVGTRRASLHFALDSLLAFPQVHDCFLQVDYTADVALAFLNGQLVQDEFWHGQPWLIGLRRHRQALRQHDLSFYFRPLRRDATCLQDLPRDLVPEFPANGQLLDIRQFQLIPQYQITLPVTAQGRRVLFIGDSITDGAWGNSGVWNATSDQRNQTDMNHIYGHGYMMIIASQYQALQPEHDWQFWNRGISGNTLSDLSARWQKDVLQLQPDVVSILVGTNDIEVALREHRTIDTAQWALQYRALLDSVLAQNPDARLVLCTPFVARAGRFVQDATYPDREQQIASLIAVVEQLSREYHATLVPFHTLVAQTIAAHPSLPVTSWIWDGIHPTPAMHHLMSQLWIDQVQL